MEERKIAEQIKKQKTLDSIKSALQSNQSQGEIQTEINTMRSNTLNQQHAADQEFVSDLKENLAGRNENENMQKMQEEVKNLKEEFQKMQSKSIPPQKLNKNQKMDLIREKEALQEQIQKLKKENELLKEKNQRLNLEIKVLKDIQPKKKKLITTQTQPTQNKTQENQLIEKLKIQLKRTEQELQRVSADQNLAKAGTLQAKGLCSCTQQKTFQLNQLEQKFQKLDELAQDYKFKYEVQVQKNESTSQALYEKDIQIQRLQDEYRKLEHYKTQISYLEQKVEDLDSERKKLQFHIRDLCQNPFFGTQKEKGPSKEQLQEFETEMDESKKVIKDLKQKLLEKENEVIQLREKNRIYQETLINERGELQRLQIQLEEKGKQWKNYEEHIQLFGKMQEEDYDQFKQALGVLKLKQDPAWTKLDFLTKTLNTDDVHQLKREIERLKLEKLTIATELDKVQILLNIKNDMEKESKEVYEREIDSLKLQIKAANTRSEEMARLADFRANRIIQLEKNMRLNVYDEQMKVIASKDQIQLQDLMIGEFEDAPLTEIGVIENVIDLYIADAEFYEQSLSIVLNEKLGKVSTFVTVDFYNHETQGTPITEGFRPNFNTMITFKFQVDDFFISYMEKESIRVEVHLCKGKEYIFFGIAQIQLDQLLIRSSPLAEQSLKTPIFEGVATIVSRQDKESSLGLLKYKIRMRKPISEALRLFKEKKDIIEQAGLQVLETFQKQPKPNLPKRILMITVYRVLKLKSNNIKNLAPFVYFKFYTFEEKISKTAAGQDAIFDENFQFEVQVDVAFQKYLESQFLDFIVFDDNIPIQDKKASDLVGTARVQLNNLLQDQNIEGYEDLISQNGIHVGQIQFRIGWIDSSLDEKGYGTPLTRVWEGELYKKIGGILKSKGLTQSSGFNVFDQDGDNLISPQEFRNTLLITLRMEISEQDIQLLLSAATLVNGGINKTEFCRKFEGILDKDEDQTQQDKFKKIKSLGSKISEQATKETLKYIFNRIKTALKGDPSKLWQAFEQLDKNHTYQVSPDNFRYIVKILQIQLSESELNQLMFKYDPNNKGHFNYVEFLKNLQDSLQNNEEFQMMKKIGKYLQQSNISLIESFKFFDKNGNGKISMNEFFQAFQQLNLNIPTAQVQNLWNATERDQDDQLNYSQFCERFTPHVGSEVAKPQQKENTPKSKPEDVRAKLSRLIKEHNVDIKSTFDFFDKNKDGKITKQEFQKGLENLKIQLTFYDVNSLVQLADQDKNGIVDYYEFCQFVQPRNETTLKKLKLLMERDNLEIEDAFMEFDLNNDGYISRQEFNEFFVKKKLKLYPQEIEELINLMSSQNNKVSYKDFLKALKELDQIKEQQSFIEKVEKPEEPEEDPLKLIAEVINSDRMSIRKVFESFDYDRSGSISQDELQKMFNTMGLKLNAAQIKKTVSQISKNSSGLITYSEFISAFAKYGVAPEPQDLNPQFFKSEQETFRSQNSSRSKQKKETDDVQFQEALLKINIQLQKKDLKVQSLFSLHDSNADGKLTVAEFKACIEGLLAGLSPAQFSALFKQVDSNLDGTISIKEFEEMLQQCKQLDQSFNQSFNQSINQQKKPKTPADIAIYIQGYMNKNNFDTIKIFNKFDSSQNSQLSKLELDKALKNIGYQVTPREFDTVWQDLTSGDKVNFTQFSNFMKKYQAQQEEHESRQKLKEAGASLKETINSNRSKEGQKK